MKLDFKRHKLLKILSDKRIKFESGQLIDNEPLGTSFETITSKMRCDRQKLSLISDELYKNNEVGNYNVKNVVGLCCADDGLSSFANGKYKARYWKDFWNKLIRVSQSIVPIAALIVTMMALIMQSKETDTNKKQIQDVEEQLRTQQKTLDSQTKKIQIVHETIFLNDSLKKP